MKNWFYNTYLYAGLNKDDFLKIKERFYRPNLKALRISSISCFIILLFFSNLRFHNCDYEGGHLAFIISSLCCLVTTILSFVLKRNCKTTCILVALFTFLIYSISIYIGTIGHIDMVSVAYVVSIIVIPMVFNAPPIFLINQMLFSVVIFFILAFKFKRLDIAKADLVNVLSICFISILVNVNSVKAKAKSCLCIIKNKNRKEELSKVINQVNDYNKSIQEGYKIFQSLGEVYTSMYYIDLREDRFNSLTSAETLVKEIGEFGEAQKSLNLFCTNIIEPMYQQSLLDFVDLSTVSQRLGDKKFLTQEFKIQEKYSYNKSINGLWRLACIIDAGRDNEKKLTHIIFATRSIHETKVKELETLERLRISNKAKTDFLLNMSHDIRTPLNAIQGFIKLAQDNKSNSNLLPTYIEKIAQSSEYLSSILSSILDMSAIETGQEALDEEPCNTSEFEVEINSIFGSLFKKKDISLEVSVSVKNRVVMLDKAKLRKVILSIINNAYKYTPECGSVKVSISELPLDKTGYVSYCTVVEDSGIGMSKDFQKHLFEPFARESSTTESKVQGAGLGLCTAKHFIDLMGGIIEVESELGQGSKFTVITTHKIVDLNKHEDIVDENVSFLNKRVLVAEDNVLNAEIVITLLENFGFEADLAKDGISCVKMMEDCTSDYYDLILMDILMPNMNGYTATKIIRHLPDKNKANIPIIAMTANAFDEDRRLAIEMGMNDHLAKPLEVSKILSSISAVLK